METIGRLADNGNRMETSNEIPMEISKHSSPVTSFKDRLIKESVISIIRMFLPSDYESSAEKIYDVISKSDAPECDKILSACAGSNPQLSCKDALPECIISSFITDYPTEPIMETGDINLQELTNNFANTVGYPSATYLVRRLQIQCSKYLDLSTLRILYYINPLRSELTPQHPYICQLILGKIVPEITSVTNRFLSSTCHFESAYDKCASVKTRAAAQFSSYFPAYLSIILGQTQDFFQYDIGSTIVRSFYPSKLKQPLPPLAYPTPRQCMTKSSQRVQCLAAAILAEACEASCAIARCATRMIYDDSQCTKEDAHFPLERATILCQLASRYLDIRQFPATCTDFVTSTFLFFWPILSLIVFLLV